MFFSIKSKDQEERFQRLENKIYDLQSQINDLKLQNAELDSKITEQDEIILKIKEILKSEKMGKQFIDRWEDTFDTKTIQDTHHDTQKLKKKIGEVFSDVEMNEDAKLQSS